MAISKHPYFPKGSWVQVVHPNHPYFDRVGQVAVVGRNGFCEVDFDVEGKVIRKPFANTSLCKADPPEVEPTPGVEIIVTKISHPYYQRRGILRDLIAGNEIALVWFGENLREGGMARERLIQIHRADMRVLEPGSSAGTDKGDRKIRSAQG